VRNAVIAEAVAVTAGAIFAVAGKFEQQGTGEGEDRFSVLTAEVLHVSVLAWDAIDDPPECTAERNAMTYLDASLDAVCQCRTNPPGPRWCPVHAGNCGTATSCG